jgi:hypothetical protein
MRPTEVGRVYDPPSNIFRPLGQARDLTWHALFAVLVVPDADRLFANLVSLGK